MDYKEKYEQALEVAKETYNKQPMYKDWLESMFPELKESEDEKVRKEIVGFIQIEVEDEIVGNKWIAWLEKQGEQKPSDKVEPRFKVGDWITNGDYTWKIVEVETLDYILQSQDGNVVDDTISHVDEQFHSFTIEDAKDGDVLTNGKMVVIFKRFEEPSYRQHIVAYIGLDRGGDIQITDDTWRLGIDKTKPATKEQRDLLFQEMKEAGYEWDAEKKELKKIEDEEYNGEDYGIDSLYHAQRILEKTLGKVDGYQTDDGILSHKCAITAVKKLYEQKSTWSEGDEERIKNILSVLDVQVCWDGATGKKGNPYQKEIDWLKSLKDRVQPKQEWHEDDEDMIQALNACIDAEIKSGMNYISFDSKSILIGKVKNWLKSLKQRIGG